MPLNGQLPNGSAQAPIEIPSLQTVIGINFGNSFASIAVLTKEGLAECIANEDGERQIACAISFHGEETYIGNEAKQQLVKNGANTIVGFRNLLGKKFSELPKDRSTSSAPVIQHPDIPDAPAYKVKVLQPAPSPLSLPASSVQTPRTNNTPAASQFATPRSEPIPAERILTPADVTTLFLRSLLQSAEAFLGKPVDGAVLTVPGWFAPAQLDALQEAALAAGIHVLQLLEDAGAAALCAHTNASTTATTTGSSDVVPDRTQLVVDLGASSLSLSLLSVRQGLFHHLTPPAHHLGDVGGDAIDVRLLKFFAKDFTKKTSEPLKIAPAASDAVADLRAEARLRLALLHTKRTIAASSVGGGNTATCAVESLKDGLDYTGSINRLRFDMEAAPIYVGVVARAGELLQRAGLDWVQVDEVVYAGGSACLPGLDSTLAVRLDDSATTPFVTGTVAGGGIGDPTTILARGAALQARMLAEIGGGTSVEDERVRKAFERGSELVGVKATARTIGVLFPEAGESGGLGGQWIGGVQSETAVPARRTYALEVDLGEYDGEKLVGLEVWEVKEGVKVEKVKPAKEEDEDERAPESEDEEDEVEVAERTITKEVYLGALAVRAREGRKRGSGWRTSIEVQFLIEASGKLEVSAYERGNLGTKDVIVPYSELANWDGSLSDIVDSLSPPSPPETSSVPHHTRPIFISHEPDQQVDSPVVANPSTTSSSSHFGPSDALFPNAAQESSSVLSPQEREIMADITLDPDDPNPFVGNSAAAAAAWVWAALTSKSEMENDNDDASSQATVTKDASATKTLQQQSRSPFATSASVATSILVSHNPILPAPPAIGVCVASIPASVSPSPFAPPPAPAPISGPVSQLVPPTLSSPSSHPSAKAKSPEARVHPDQLAVSGDLEVDERLEGSEHVIEPASASDGGASLEGNTVAGLSGYLDRLQARSPSLQSPVPPPLDNTNRSSSSRSPAPARHPSKTPLFLPSPSGSVTSCCPPADSPLAERNSNPEPPDVISINSSSTSSSPKPPRRSRRNARKVKSKTKINKQGRQLMAYVLIPPFPPGTRESDYVPLKKIPRIRENGAIAKGKARAGDNAGSSALVAALQGAFENNSSAAGRAKTLGARKKRRKMVKPAEVAEVLDEADEGEGKGEVRNQDSTNLALALSNAFAHNSADPKVLAQSAAVVRGRTRQLRRNTHVEILSDSSVSVEVLFSSPPAKHRPPLRARVTLDNDNSSPSPSRRNEKRQPHTLASPQKKKRRRLAWRDEVDGYEVEAEEEIEIVNGASRDLPRRASGSRTKPPSFSNSDLTQAKSIRTSKQRPVSTFSPAPISVPTSLPSPSQSPLPRSSSAPPRGTNMLVDLPLTILPAPAATDIVIPTRALNHLNASPGPPDPEFGTRDYDFLQDFHCEEAAVGAHGLLESRSAPAAITATATMAASTSSMDSNLCANTTGLRNRLIDLGLDVAVPMDTVDGNEEQMQDRQDAAARVAVVPFDALRMSNSTHPEGPMLGFVLSEPDATRCTTSLSADVDTEASSDGVGLELGANTCSDMELLLLASTNPNSGFSAGPGWIDWEAAGPSTDLVGENEYVGDGTIDPSVLGGAGCFPASPGGGRPDKSPLFIRATDKDKYLEDDDVEDEGDVMGLLFENPTESRTPSAGKSKKNRLAVAGADVTQVDFGISAKATGSRKRTKSWKSFANGNDKTDHCEDTETEDDDAVKRRYPSNTSSDISSPLTKTFCHHCRRSTSRPKMRCTRIRESTGDQCRKLYCDLCIERRYPSLTFDEFATSFSCPCCGEFCNCSHCARKRGEDYISERNGGWRRLAALSPAAVAATSGQPPLPKEARQDVVELAEPERKGTVARAASTTEAFLEPNDSTRFVPVKPAAEPLLPSPPSTSPALVSTFKGSGHLQPVPTTTTASTTAVVDKTRRRYMYIGQPLKSWGSLVSVPDPDPDPEDQPLGAGLGRKTGRNGRKRKRAVRLRLFAGSKEPLLLNQSHVNKKKKRTKRKRKRKGEQNGQRPSESSLPPGQTSPLDADARGEGEGEGTNQMALHEDSDLEADHDLDDVDEGVWPGEYAHEYEHVVVPNASGAVAIPQEELERAISVAIAVGKQYLQW